MLEKLKDSQKILDGKKLQSKIFAQLSLEIKEIKSRLKKTPHLHFICIGNNPASQIYIKYKKLACASVGITSSITQIQSSNTQELLGIIETLNKDENVNAILVQLPLPENIDVQKIIEAISPVKDVDGFHPYNTGRLWQNTDPYFFPCTPLGILELLKEYKISPTGKNVVILNRSNIVGKPLAGLLAQKREFLNATVTLCNSYTQNINSYISQADILVSAVGNPHFIKKEMIKQNSVIIDVASTFNTSTKVFQGDVDFDSVIEKCSFITPSPGGVGPMTIAMLMKNTLHALKIQNKGF